MGPTLRARATRAALDCRCAALRIVRLTSPANYPRLPTFAKHLGNIRHVRGGRHVSTAVLLTALLAVALVGLGDAAAIASVVIALSPADAAKALGCSRSKFYELLNAGEIPSFKIGTTRKIAVADLEAYVERAKAAEREAAQ